MSKRWLAGALVAGLWALAPRAASAQTMDADRFFVDKEDESEEGQTLFQGSLTSSSFYFHESGDAGDPPIGGTVAPASASPFSRLFTELRAQLDARHVKGGRWDARVDARARLVNDPADEQTTTQDNRLQSGLFGGSEYELRELYAVRGGRRADVFVGRQVVADVAAIKIDGLRVDYARSRRWTLLGFGGLYPRRGSRSLTTDYPAGVDRLGQPTGSRVLPVAGGAGAAYRTDRGYGSLGGGAIAAKGEVTRVFVSASGYWRQGPRLDLWHYLVVDVRGAGGFALTNASLGLQWKPQPRLRVALAGHRIDTEALSVQVRDQLDTGLDSGGYVVNNLVAQRIEADAVRATVSSSLGPRGRYELSAGLAGRRRPAVALTPTVSLAASQSVDITVQATDRRSLGGTRLDLAVTRAVGLGEASYARSNVLISRLTGRRSWKDDRLELEGELAYLTSRDDNAGRSCALGDPATCFGSASTRTVQLSLFGAWRVTDDLLASGSLGYGRQSITLAADAGGAQPPITSLTGFLRVGYRF